MPASPAHAQKADFSGIEITVLSSAAGRSSAYLLAHGEALLLVDCGPGTASPWRATASSTSSAPS